MKAGILIELVKEFKQKVIRKQLYELATKLRDIERDLACEYKFEDDIDADHFILLLHDCLTIHPLYLPEEESFLLKKILRELKLNRILNL